MDIENNELKLIWTCKPFSELSASELYNILEVRSEVFVVEQNCVYQDVDKKDLSSWHLAGFHKNVLVAYARLVPPGLSYTEPSIGRVLTLKDKRRFGFGMELMQESIKQIKLLFGDNPVRISAQCYLISFYEKWGFRCVDEPYLEDGIPHQEMLMP
jgi:ElaA protein